MNSHSIEHEDRTGQHGLNFPSRKTKSGRFGGETKSLDLRFRDQKGGYSLRFNYTSFRPRGH